MSQLVRDDFEKICSFLDNEKLNINMIRTMDNSESIKKKIKIALITDVKNWAFDNIAIQIKKNLKEQYEFIIVSYEECQWNPANLLFVTAECDVLHFFWREIIHEILKLENYEEILTNTRVNSKDFLDQYLYSKILSTCVYDHYFLQEEDKNKRTIIFNDFNYYVSSMRLYSIYKNIKSYKLPKSIIEDGVDDELFYLKNHDRFLHVQRPLIIGWVGNSKWNEGAIDNKGFITIIKPVIESMIIEGYDINALYADRVNGYILHEDMIDYYSKIDVLVCMSFAEGTPNPILEAMACGVTIITTDVGIVPQVFGPKQSEFIIDRSKYELKRSIIRLLDNREILKEISRENLDFIKPWSWKSQSKKIELYFSEISKKQVKKMNIWILTSEYPPDYGGGIGMYVNQAARMMAAAGHKVTVLVRDSKESSVNYEESNIRVIRFLHMQGDYYQYLGYWTALAYQYAEEVKKLIHSDGSPPDIIEIQEYNGIGYYILMQKWQFERALSNVPILLHLHTPTFELDRVNQAPRYKFPNYWIGHMEKFCMRAADALVSPSQFLADQIQHIAPENPIKVINLPYQLEEYESGYTRDFESNTFLYFGRTEYRKGVSQMIKGAENLWNKGHKFKLKIIGGDTYFHPRGMNLGEYLKEKYKKWIDLGFLIFKNAVPPSELNPEILKAKAVIVPSLYENFPYTCLTSMWLGAPMLVSSSGGQAEMVNDDRLAGMIYNWDIEGDFEEKLLRMIYADSIELKEMSNEAHKRIRELCNIDKNLKLRINYYEEVIEKTKSRVKLNYPSQLESEKTSRTGKSIPYITNKLSIVIPYYNLGKHIDETIQSALSSQYEDYEIIIVNDGSTDQESIEVLDKYRENYPNVRIVDIINKGLANARNVGAMEAHGEFITFLDADDLVDSSFYSRSVNILKSYQNVSFVYCWLQYFENVERVWPTFNTEFPYLLTSNMLSAFVVVRKSDFINYGLNKVSMEYGMEDYEGWVSMCANGCIGVSIPEPLVKYRVRSDSMSRQFNRDMIIYLREKMAELNPAVYQKHGMELFKLMDANGPGYLWDNPTFTYPIIGFGNQSNETYQDMNSQKYELMRLAQSKWGSRLIKLVFKLKLNKYFK